MVGPQNAKYSIQRVVHERKSDKKDKSWGLENKKPIRQ
jgi:hypothetical protein